LFDARLDPSELSPDGNYTIPKSWGVYRLSAEQAGTSARYRIGNHPVRESELRREFGHVSVMALYGDRKLAEELAGLLNDAGDR